MTPIAERLWQVVSQVVVGHLLEARRGSIPPPSSDVAAESFSAYVARRRAP